MNSSLSDNEHVSIRCDFCDESFENEIVLAHHMNEQHSNTTSENNLDLETIANVDIAEESHDEREMSQDTMHNVFPCLECGKIYKSKGSMGRHVKIHHSYGNAFYCKICSENFSTSMELKTHLQTHLNEPNVHQCVVCDKVFLNQSSLTQHIKTHRPDRPFKCLVCGNTYKEKGALSHHEKSHSSTREHVCDKCGKSFIRPRDLKHHIATHSQDKSYKCDLCDKAFRTDKHLSLHMSCHADSLPFECFICEKKFPMKRHLKRHLLSHREKKQFPCSQCNKEYHYRYRLDHHIRTAHNNERHFQCEVCNRQFGSNDNLKVHFRTHSGERPYKCSMCEKSFTQWVHKQRHELVHTDMKAFKCSLCKKAFPTQYDLKRHMIVHQTPDGKPFKCTKCEKGFVRACSLRAHDKTIHQGVRHTCMVCQKTFKIACRLKEHMSKHLEVHQTEDTGKERGEIKKNDEISEEQTGGDGEIKEGSVGSSLVKEQAVSKTQDIQFTKQDLESSVEHQNTSENDNSHPCDKNEQAARSYSCNKCSQSFCHEQIFKRHIHSCSHRTPKPIKCQLCKKGFETKSELESHAPSCTGPAAEFVCSICGKTFGLKANLKRHMEIHSDIKPMQCLQCDKQFRNKSFLKRHQVIHSDVRSFKCNSCGKGFRRATDLVKHERTHTGVAPYKCRYCNKAFKQSNNRQRHERTHVEKRFKCKTCDQRFSSRSECKEHKLSHLVADESVVQDTGVMEDGKRREKGSNRDDEVEQRGVDETEDICGVGECDEVGDDGEVTEENIALQENNEVTPTAQGSQVSEMRQGKVQICLSDNSNQLGQRNKGQIGTEIRREGIDKDRHGEKRKEIQRKQQDKAKKVSGNVEAAGQRIEKQFVQKSKDVGTQDNGVGKVVGARKLGDASRDIGETNDSGITKIIEEKDVFLIKDSNPRKDSERRKAGDLRNDIDKTEDHTIVSSNDDEIRNDCAPRNGESINIEKDVDKIKDGDPRARASNSRDQTYIISISEHDEEAVKSSEAIRKILEGKPFICPVCDKAYASRNGLKHHYDKTHLKPGDKKSYKVTDHITMHLFFCHECDEGFKTEGRFCFHNIKVHGQVELSSDEESDSEMIGQGKNISVLRAITYSMKDMTARDDCNAGNDVIGYVGTCDDATGECYTKGDVSRGNEGVAGVARGDGGVGCDARGDQGLAGVARGDQGLAGVARGDQGALGVARRDQGVASVARGDGGVGGDAKDERSAGKDPRTNGNDNVNETSSYDVDYVDGRKLVQRKITEWFRSTTK